MGNRQCWSPADLRRNAAQFVLKLVTELLELRLQRLGVGDHRLALLLRFIIIGTLQMGYQAVGQLGFEPG